MNCVNNQYVMIIGGLGLAFIALTICLALLEPKRTDLPPEFMREGMAFQLGGTAEVVKNVFGKEGEYRKGLITGLYIDFVYIACYVLLLGGLGLALSRVNVPPARLIGWAAILSVLLAAGFDLLENSRMLKVLALPAKDITDSMAVGIRQAAMLKWGLFFLSLTLIGCALVLRVRLVSLIGAFFLLSGLIGFVALANHRFFPYAFYLLGPGLIGIAIGFTVWSHRFSQDFC
jgi:hypothetical protein